MAGIPADTKLAPRAWLRSNGMTRRWLLVAVCALAFSALENRAAAPMAKEYEVKAAFLFYFAQYVEWPADAFQAPTAPIIIGILGDDAVGRELERIVRGETVKNRPITIHRSRQVENLKHSHLIFVSKSERTRLGSIFAALAGKPCLTVGETDRFAHVGGIINFRLQGANVRFEINRDAAKQNKLMISSRLLSVADVVSKEGH